MTASFVDPPGGPATNGPAALVKGGGELGTAVALALWRAGWRVVVAELPRPTVLRRQLSLAEAAFCGAVTRDGVRARRVAAPAEAVVLLRVPQSLPLYVGPLPELLRSWRPALVVDARMRRGVAPERQRHEAPLVVGLGPELVAGRDVDWVIETCPGPDLGRVIGVGAARPHAPLPRGAGSAAEEYVRAPHAGLWRTDRAIGDEVAAGERLGWLDAASLRAPVAGCLRGLVHDGVTVPAGAKLVAVHPGDWRRKESGIGQRAAAVAASVLQLAATRAAQHGAAPPGLAVALPAAAT
ncbi:MAG TPA: hypothetical protein VK066_18700 [Chloroflexota bacterium]|nr:hypothetical protein [Chloroflexota bacterium]